MSFPERKGCSPERIEAKIHCRKDACDVACRRHSVVIGASPNASVNERSIWVPGKTAAKYLVLRGFPSEPTPLGVGMDGESKWAVAVPIQATERIPK